MMRALHMMMPAAMMCPAGHKEGKHRIIATEGSNIISERQRRNIISRQGGDIIKVNGADMTINKKEYKAK